MSKHFPDMIDLCFDPEGTKRDGFWLMHRCRERGITPVKVAALVSFCGTGIEQVNASPVALLQKRMGA
ncbi:hypothetical protein QEZ52_20595 [Aliisedimentitalea scapharcae]|uniref:Uncharacterized protein n=1 Tax=Aliisedimentitalea scapharcae TaxID=1524259 RepID=A0ABZ2XS97_9RHOB